jgi:ketosteroid isomerase-like protein
VSEKSFEPILRALDAVNRRDAEAFGATASPDIEWEDANYWTEVSRTYRGKVEVREPFNGAVAQKQTPSKRRASGVGDVQGGSTSPRSTGAPA